MERHLLHLIYRVKTWHYDAERDGRVVVRMGGKRYRFTATRVVDPGCLPRCGPSWKP